MIYRPLLPITLLLVAVQITVNAQDVPGSYSFQVLQGDADETSSLATGPDGHFVEPNEELRFERFARRLTYHVLGAMK